MYMAIYTSKKHWPKIFLKMCATSAMWGLSYVLKIKKSTAMKRLSLSQSKNLLLVKAFALVFVVLLALRLFASGQEEGLQHVSKETFSPTWSKAQVF